MTAEMTLAVLAWVAVGLGSLVLVLLSWFALRVVSQLDHATELMNQQYLAFREEIHRHDLRIARLEVWREGGGRPARESDR